MIDPREPLTAHFSWAEVERSDTALRRGIRNLVPPMYEGNARRMAAVMEQIRARLGQKPLTVHSWFRSDMLNSAVGGSKASAHKEARACDFDPPELMPLEDCFEAIRLSDIPYDQLIEERTRSGAAWIHISVAVDGEAPRRDALRARGDQLGGPMAYTRVAKG